ncbi:malate synthase G [Sphingomonas sanguinis]|uniref:malate synthase G n=1 Tax=Sphingomonas sp. LC-1 TaxID=3110957 RepID=UPI0021BB7618|nr:malate synthase G [Sphingomonas sp. LC-1]MCT8002196.1 malate synthase G [Sphingomonas sp. LC-1]
MIDRYGLSVAPALVRFLEEKVLPGSGIEPRQFWEGLASILECFAPENADLLRRRDALQQQIDDWYRQGGATDGEAQRRFLTDIGYLVPEPEPFVISPTGVDDEVSRLAGPQLVVPMLNARFLLNAANARWGSLYDALYGTDAIAPPSCAPGYDQDRGAAVIRWVRAFLNDALPIEGDWATISDLQTAIGLLREPGQFRGRSEKGWLFRHHGLHIEIVVDAAHPIGSTDPAGIADVLLESALTTICDLEDSVAAVDAQDKVAGYAHWLGLIKGTLTAPVGRGGKVVTRRLAPDRSYQGPGGEAFTLPGRSLLFVRNVGHLMTTPAIRLPNGGEAPEGIVDAVVTSLIAMRDGRSGQPPRNGRFGSIYIVKPKMHGPEEAAFANRLFDAVEDMLGLDRHRIKIGVMDEERRTSANLAACIHAVRHRVVFINTGFLDRTGDEIHSAMQAGPMIRKGAMKEADWIAAYEDRNVQIGLACGFAGRAQIGKGMWAAPDRMADMLAQKEAHPRSGATTAWVPSPTAATLHATHYHRVDVSARQAARGAEPVAAIERLVTPPVALAPDWAAQDIADELDNNAQGLLGYVVRWIDQGVGCSKVPDLHDIGLMEDRATLRISSQHIANWLHHGIVTSDQVEAALARMAAKVDEQNRDDPGYRPLLGSQGDSLALQAARALIFEGREQPNGYTEPLLHRYRQLAKQQGTG